MMRSRVRLPVFGFRVIAQCHDMERLMHAITTFPEAIVFFSSSLHPNLERLRTILESAGSRAIVIARTVRRRWLTCVRVFAGRCSAA